MSQILFVLTLSIFPLLLGDLILTITKKARATFLISFETPYSSSEYEPLISVETGGWGGENTGVFDVQPTGFRFDCTTNEVLAVAPRELNIVVFGK